MSMAYLSEPPPGSPDAPHPEYEEYSDFSSFFRRCRQRLWIPLLLSVLGVTYAYWISKHTPVAYQSEVRILFPGMTSTGGLSALAPSLGQGDKSQPMDMYAEVLKSTRIVQPIAQKYHLDQYGIVVRTPEDVKEIVQVRTNALAATLTLTAVAPRADIAPSLARDLCESLSQFVRNSALSNNKNTAGYLSRRIQQVEERLQRKDEELRRYQETHRLAGGAASGVSTGPALAARLNDVNTSLKANQAKIAEVRRQITLQVDHPERLSGQDSLLAQKWRDQMGSKMHDLALSEAQYGPDHPQVVLLRKEIADLKMRYAKDLAGARFALQQGITPQLAGLLADQEALLAQQTSLNQLITQIPAQEMRLGQLNREIVLLSTLYSSLQQNYQEAQMQEMNDPSRFVFLDEPSVPNRPARPRWRRNLAMGAIAGLVLGILLAISFPERSPRRRLLATGVQPLYPPTGGAGETTEQKEGGPFNPDSNRSA